MNKGELERVQVLARMRGRKLEIVYAARLMRVSYPPGRAVVEALSGTSLKHGGAGRASPRA